MCEFTLSDSGKGSTEWKKVEAIKERDDPEIETEENGYNSRLPN